MTWVFGVRSQFRCKRSEVPEVRANGFWGQITISLRSEAQHPKGEPQARGICALTPKTPDPEFSPPVPASAHIPVRAEVSKPFH